MSQHVYPPSVYSKLDGTEEKFNHLKFMGMGLPESYDLRAGAPPVYDQGQQGSCTANAGVAARVMLAKNPELALSRAFLYYCERLLEGDTEQDNGACMKDIGAAAQWYGICPEPDMPYSDKDYTTAPSQQAYEDAVPYKISGAKLVTSDVNAIKTAFVARSQPVLVGMTVYASMEDEQVATTGVLPMPAKGEQVLGGHAVLAVGWLPALPAAVQDKLGAFHAGKRQKSWFRRILDGIFGKTQPSGYFILRNSWGDKWGDKGYFYMPFEYVTAGYANEFWILEG